MPEGYPDRSRGIAEKNSMLGTPEQDKEIIKELTAAQCRHLRRELSQFEWPWPIRKRFGELGLTFIGDLVQCHQQDFYKPGQVGPKAIKLIEDTLKELDGLTLLARPLTEKEWEMAQEAEVVAPIIGPALLDGFPVEERVQQELNRPIEFTGLNNNTKDLLRQAGIKCLGELIKHTEADLLKLKPVALGRKAVQEIRNLLSELGLKLGSTIENWAPPEELQEV